MYETKCITCETREREKLKEEIADEKEREKKMKEIKVYKYIGETCRHYAVMPLYFEKVNFSLRSL